MASLAPRGYILQIIMDNASASISFVVLVFLSMRVVLGQHAIGEMAFDHAGAYSWSRELTNEAPCIVQKVTKCYC